ncbi:MAG: hypothetical protein SGPRY_002900 [Prymnesium sp.]
MASELQLLASPDDALLTALIVTAKACVGEARMLQRAAVAPLAALLREASLGELPQSAWAARMDAIPRAEGAECITAGELMVTLLPQVPSDAHARRLRAALAWLEREGGESPAGLVILLQGTTLLRGAQVDLPLLRSIYEALKRVALPPLHLLGLVQQPLLLECQRALGIDEWFSPPPAEPTDHLRQTETGGSVTPDAEETDSAHVGEMARAAFLEAAALARLGDQRGSKHGCVLVDGASGNVLGRGYNHQVYEDVSELALPPRILRGVRRGKKRVLHAECDAVANAIQQMGEEAAFASFAASTAWIVELAAYMPLLYACQSKKLRCRRLEEILRNLSSENPVK